MREQDGTGRWEDRAEKFSKEWNYCYGQEMGPFTPKEHLPDFYGGSMFPKFQEYQPEMITVEKFFLLHDLKFSIEAGLEYAQECLTRHDQELGRTTKKNKSWAETIEKDVAQMKQALERIKKYENL